MTAPRSMITPALELAAVIATRDGRAIHEKMRELADNERAFLLDAGYDREAAKFLATCGLAMIQDAAKKLNCMTGVE